MSYRKHFTELNYIISQTERRRGYTK